MNQIPTTPPSGFRDFLPEETALRARSIETISGVYRSYGFQQLATSAVEDLAVLLGKGGGENEKLIFKLLKRGAQLDEAKAARIAEITSISAARESEPTMSASHW